MSATYSEIFDNRIFSGIGKIPIVRLEQLLPQRTHKIDSGKPDTKIIPANAEGSQTFESANGKFELPDMGASRTPDNLNPAKFDPFIYVNDFESIIGRGQLLEKETILAGTSTCTAVFSNRKSMHRLPLEAKVAFQVADRGERNINTIYNNQWAIDNFTKSTPFIFTNPYLA